MSKSKGNVVSPDEIVERYGSDSLRLYELFIGPPELDSEWNDNGIEGIYRFLNKVWNLVTSHQGTYGRTTGPLERERNRVIMEVTQRLEAFKLNTAVSSLMSYVNFLNDYAGTRGTIDRESLETLVLLLAPFAPHIAEELWQRLGHDSSVFAARWPDYDPGKVEEELLTLPVQVNGKLRGTVQVHREASEAEVLSAAKESSAIARHITGKRIVKEIYVPGKVVSIVVR